MFKVAENKNTNKHIQIILEVVEEELKLYNNF